MAIRRISVEHNQAGLARGSLSCKVQAQHRQQSKGRQESKMVQELVLVLVTNLIFLGFVGVFLSKDLPESILIHSFLPNNNVDKYLGMSH